MRGAVALIEADSYGVDRVVTVRGEVDVGSAPSLRDWLSRASDGGTRSVCVDLRGVQFLAISGLYVLCDEAARMAREHVRLTIVCTDPRVLQLFSVCRLDDVLHLVDARPADEPPPWSGDDDARAERLAAWLRRYAAESA